MKTKYVLSAIVLLLSIFTIIVLCIPRESVREKTTRNVVAAKRVPPRALAAVAGNLLNNPGFEAVDEHGGRHADGHCVYWDADGEVRFDCPGWILAPLGWWVGFHDQQPCGCAVEGCEWKTGMPESRVICLSDGFDDPERVYAGDCAFQIFTFWRCHRFWLMQRVPVEPGERYFAGAMAHSFYTDCDHPHWPPFDKTCTVQIGGTPEECRALHDDCIAGGGTEEECADVCWAHDYLAVGLDQTGGLDPRAPTVTWGGDREVYGRYGPVLALHPVVATGPWMTVFVASDAWWPLRNCDVYVDAAWMVWVANVMYLPVVIGGR